MKEHLPFPRRAVPPLARAVQNLPAEHIADPRAEVRRMLTGRGLKLKPGARVAITAGSRGIGGFVPLLAGIADAVKEAGGEPFLIPAMGSHGRAMPEGQTEILRILGATEDAVGAPVRATMETVELGTAQNGAAAHVDRIAHEADGIIVFGRTKTHPESAQGLASGLLKMVTVGLGKQAGAQQAHNHGLWESVRLAPRITMARAKILYGVAVVENAYRQPYRIEVVEPAYEAFLESDKRLLEVARTQAAHIPFSKLDLLIVDQMGKTISGTGMDLNVIGKWRVTGGPREPDFRRIVALSLTEGSLGNGLGAGMADFITRRLMDAYDPGATYVNLLTAAEPGGTTAEGPLPLALDSDREAIEVGLYSSLAGPRPRVCRIHSTAELGEMWISDALIEEARRKGLAVDAQARTPAYDERGNLM